jgi:hypothetical protein
MSKKAKEVVEAAPKYTQPWQGFLSLSAIIVLAYATYWWFLNPVSGLLTKSVQANAYVLTQYFSTNYPAYGSLGIVFALNNPSDIYLYPQGYLVNWASYFILAIVWFISIAVLARPFTPSKSRIGKQPWAGLIILVLSMVLAFIMWYILVIVLKWEAVDLITLGAIGFAVFPIWATLFGYWPFIPRRPQTHAIIRGTIFVVIAWIIAFIIRFIAVSRMATGSITTVYSQMFAVGGQYGLGLFLYGIPLTAVAPTEPWDFVNSLFLSLITANILWSIIAPFPNMSQPKRGLITFIMSIITALIMWGILTMIVGPTATGEIVPTIYSSGGVQLVTILPIPYIAHADVSAYLAFAVATLLFGQLTFAMWPWSRWGMKGHVSFVVLAFIIATILYYVMMVNPGYAAAFTGANQITSTSGIQTIWQETWYLGMVFNNSPTAWGIMWNYAVSASYLEGINGAFGYNIMFAWTVIVLVFWLLIYEGFEHWPFK